jgi:hypothetical protein
LKRTKALIDLSKYIAALVIGIAAIGWLGREYISRFQTTEEAEDAQQANDDAHQRMETAIDENGEAVDNLRIYNVRIELEQRSTNDRLDQLLELEQAGTKQARRNAQRRVEEIQQRIDRRERVIRSPAALQRVADQVEEDPLSGLNGGGL